MQAAVTIKLQKDPSILSRLCREVHDFHYHKHPDLFKPYDYEQIYGWFVKFLTSPQVHSFIAYHHRQPVGYLLLSQKDNRGNPFIPADFSWMHIEQMSVNAGHQKQGIGKMLMEAAEAWAAEQGINRIRLNVWQDNPEAIRFYKSRGFSPYRLDMEKLI